MTSSTTQPHVVGRGAIRIELDRGIHPATLKPLLEPGAATPKSRCGSCTFLVERLAGDRKARMKCAIKAQRRRGPDIKPDFPACVEFRTTVAA
ncbi:hypothetical protein [Streptomyces bacillaris]|uniref:hypothetical protein n=1 Tax=Streptomyces bacillaris TaxID=68179 RepID=UPI0037FAB36B